MTHQCSGFGGEDGSSKDRLGKMGGFARAASAFAVGCCLKKVAFLMDTIGSLARVLYDTEKTDDRLVLTSSNACLSIAKQSWFCSWHPSSRFEQQPPLSAKQIKEVIIITPKSTENTGKRHDLQIVTLQ